MRYEERGQGYRDVEKVGKYWSIEYPIIHFAALPIKFPSLVAACCRLPSAVRSVPLALSSDALVVSVWSVWTWQGLQICVLSTIFDLKDWRLDGRLEDYRR